MLSDTLLPSIFSSRHSRPYLLVRACRRTCDASPAVKEARALIAKTVHHGYLSRHHWIEIVDEAQNVVGRVRFDEAAEIRDQDLSPLPSPVLAFP